MDWFLLWIGHEKATVYRHMDVLQFVYNDGFGFYSCKLLFF
jgi:hypothetical protein